MSFKSHDGEFPRVSRKTLKDFPVLEYTARHWEYHAKQAQSPNKKIDGMDATGMLSEKSRRRAGIILSKLQSDQ